VDRKEFLSMLGLGGAAAVCSYCFGGCNPSDPLTPPPANVDFTLDLSDPSYAALKNVGSYLYSHSLIIAHTTSGVYVAASSTCTHAGAIVFYDPSGNRFHCPAHGSDFATNGSVINGPAGNALATYHATLTGTLLHIYS